MHAQQIPQYSQYMRNQFMINPGSAGVYDFLDVTMSGRWQWVGFGDEPRTAYLSATSVLGKKTKERYNPAFRVSQGPIRNPEINTGKLKHAIGGQVLADQYGAFRTMQVAGTYALHIPVATNYNLSFGTRLGLSNHSFLRDKAVVLNEASPMDAYAGGDNEYDTYVQNQGSRYIMDLGIGIYFYSKNMFVGISSDQLTKDFANFGSGTANFDTQMHFNVTGGVKIPLGDELTIMPSVLAKYMNPAPPSIEGSIMLEYMEWVWVGASYRHEDAVVGMFGLNISQKFKLGYSYDFNISRLNVGNKGAHEIVLGLMLGR